MISHDAHVATEHEVAHPDGLAAVHGASMIDAFEVMSIPGWISEREMGMTNGSDGMPRARSSSRSASARSASSISAESVVPRRAARILNVRNKSSSIAIIVRMHRSVRAAHKDAPEAA